MKGMLVGAALAIGGMLVGFAFATQAGVTAEAKWWDLMTAFGTVGAVVAAIGVPLWQNSDRLREQAARALMQDWTLAHVAYQCAGRIYALLIEWNASERPSSSVFSALHARVSLLQDRAGSVFAATVITDLSSISSALEGEAKKIENRNAINASRPPSSQLRMLVQDFPGEQFRGYLEEAERIKRNCEIWQMRVLTDVKRQGIKIPGVVRGEGTAELTLRGEAVGGVMRKQDGADGSE